MKTLADDGAFTCPADDTYRRSFGLTKREWFAGLALSGRLADPEVHMGIRDRARDAVNLADALIAALNAEPRP